MLGEWGCLPGDPRHARESVKIYIASRFADRKRLRPYADKIWHLGHEVTSTWLNEVNKMPGMTKEEFWRVLAEKDLVELGQADLIIRDVHAISHTGGADVEWGLAISQFQHKLRWLIGPTRNVFHTLAHRRFDSWELCLNALKRMPTGGEPADG